METKNIWEEKSKGINYNRLQSHFAEYVDSNIVKNSIILDLAGGAGFDTIYFLKKDHQVILCDIANNNLGKAQERIKNNKLNNNCQFLQLDLSVGKIPLGNKSVNVVYSRLGLHYFNKDITTKLLKEIYRILKEDGQAFIVVKSPQDKDEYNYLKSKAKIIDKSIFNHNGIIKSRYTESEWEELLKKAGINNYKLSFFNEDLSDRNDVVNSQNKKFILQKIYFKKS